jgi:hypothetical protein
VKRKAKAKRAGQGDRFLRDEWFLGVSLATVATFLFLGEKLYDKLANPYGSPSFSFGCSAS